MPIVFITKKNFYRLKNEEILRDFPGYTDFSVRPLGSILKRFKEHVSVFSSQGLVFKISPEVLGIMKTIKKLIAREVDEKEILRMLGIITEDVFIGPKTIHLDINNYCNLKCIHCWFHSPLRKDQNRGEAALLPLDKIKQVLHSAYKMGVFDILLLGCGETLMHPDIKEIISVLKAYNFHITLFSNGSLLDEELVDALASVEEGMGRFYFSVCAGDSQTYGKIHIGSPEGLFTDTMRNISRLSMAIKSKKYNNPPKVILVHVIHKINSNNIHKMFEAAVDAGADELQFQLTEYTPETKQLMLDKSGIAEVKAQILKITALAKKHRIIIRSNIKFQLDHVNPETGNWAETLYQTQGCYIGWDFMRIWNNGYVSFCCPPKYMGTIYKTDIASIWNSPHYNRCRIAGKYFDRNNSPLTADGKLLLNEECDLCPNYIFTIERSDSLKKSGLIKYL